MLQSASIDRYVLCRVGHLRDKCRQRGVSFEDGEQSIVACAGDVVLVDTESAHYPRPGLGDLIASGLSAVGITEDRVQAIAGAVGIKDCGCGGRKKAANELGKKYFGIGR